MKNKIFIKLILMLILIILFIKIFVLRSLQGDQITNDFLFLKLLSSSKLSKDNYSMSNNENVKEYKFKIDYKNIDFKSIDLAKTINRETLVYEKIAPGTSGEFKILLDSNQDLKYNIQFNSITEKPKNLNFRAIKDEVIIAETNTLEDLSEELEGFINKNEKISITINWYWNYENEQDKEITDIQDTKDSENIKTYQFNICTLGEEA